MRNRNLLILVTLALVACGDRIAGPRPAATQSPPVDGVRLSPSTVGVLATGDGVLKELTHGKQLDYLSTAGIASTTSGRLYDEAIPTAAVQAFAFWNANEKMFHFNGQARVTGVPSTINNGAWWTNNAFKYQVSLRVELKKDNQDYGPDIDEDSPWTNLLAEDHQPIFQFGSIYIGNNGGARACFTAIGAFTGRNQHWMKSSSGTWLAGDNSAVTVYRPAPDGCVNLEEECEGGGLDELRASASTTSGPFGKRAAGHAPARIEDDVVHPGTECGSGGTEVPYYYRCFTTITYWVETGMILDVDRRCYVVYTSY